MPISFKHRAIFIHIPKTGGQSISKYLDIPKGSPKHYYWEGLTHLKLSMIKENIEGYYIFTFVRNPYDRILSEYHWRMKNIMSVVYNEPTRQRMSFPDYMELLLSRWDNLVPEHREKAHVLPQVEFIEEGMDVYRYEHFEDECKRLAKKLNIIGPIPFVNKGHYKAQHTERTREITRILYEDDFRELGYDDRISATLK